MELIQHLENLAVRRMPPAHISYLEKLKKSGFEPKVIYDIGSCVLTWTKEVRRLWPDAKVILFDAYEPVEVFYSDYDYHIGVLSNEDGKTVKFYESDIHPGGNSYYREIGGAPDVFPEDKYKLKVARTLDSVVKERGFPAPDFIKLDVQGSERDILAGATETLKSVKRLVTEIQSVEYNKDAPLVGETLPFIESLGFKCCDPLFSNNGPDGDYGFIAQ